MGDRIKSESPTGSPRNAQFIRICLPKANVGMTSAASYMSLMKRGKAA
jgi:hypothetical protein